MTSRVRFQISNGKKENGLEGKESQCFWGFVLLMVVAAAVFRYVIPPMLGWYVAAYWVYVTFLSLLLLVVFLDDEVKDVQKSFILALLWPLILPLRLFGGLCRSLGNTF